MFIHLYQKIILDYIRGRSLIKYKLIDIEQAIYNYY